MWLKLGDHQLNALTQMHNGCILCGGVGTGKTRTSLAYYYQKQGGNLFSDEYEPMNDPPQDLYVITTAHTRDTYSWNVEMAQFLISPDIDVDIYEHTVVVDSWNNIKKYIDVSNAFFIFDEQRVCGSGAWAKAFLKITQKNNWILLSATPGDTWIDYMSVFIANGFYRNISDFKNQHVKYAVYPTYKIDSYINTTRLERLRSRILVEMSFDRDTISHHIDILSEYNKMYYREIMRTRWNPETNEPFETVTQLCYKLREICNSDPSRIDILLNIFKEHPKLIVFYNFDYELEILRNTFVGNDLYNNFEYAEWNGHKHQPIPNTKRWVYAVQYNAGVEGWNCIKTDTVVFYSANYSYKTMVQAAGRIDRMNTPYQDLWYYHLYTTAPIDKAIQRAIKTKKQFNETNFLRKSGAYINGEKKTMGKIDS